MKVLQNLWNRLKEIIAILAFISAAVAFFMKGQQEKITRGVVQKDLQEIKQSINDFEEFQHNQITINAVEENQLKTLKEIVLTFGP